MQTHWLTKRLKRRPPSSWSLDTRAQADGGVANPNLEGLFTVLSVGVGYLVVNSPWSLVTNAAINGDITYADGRKTVTRNILIKANNYVFNGALPWTQWPYYLFSNYFLTGPSDSFLTSCPTREFYCTLSKDLWMNAVYGGPGYWANTSRAIYTYGNHRINNRTYWFKPFVAAGRAS